MSVLESLDEYVKSQSDIIEELKKIESDDFKTKEQKIIRLKEVTRPLIEAGYYEGVTVGHLASFIQKDILEKHNITYPNNGRYYSLFAEDEKREYSTSGRKEISSLPIEQQTGNDELDKLKAVERNGFEFPKSAFTDYLNLLEDCSTETTKQVMSIIRKMGNAFAYETAFDRIFPDKKELEKQIESIVGKKKKELQERYEYYLKSQETIKNIEEEIGDVLPKTKMLKEILAEQKHISSLLDERITITFVEKWKAILCDVCESTLGISAIAKRLRVDKKHISNNIRPTNNPVTCAENKHHNYINWFTAINITTPSGEKLVFDMKDWADRQIERKKLDLPFEDIVLKTCEIE
ncbi:hypothetical protein [Nitrososphaeria virus YSH_462411]|uniref:Uncharacterized protein n=1 Tax=Nitrososphaeria virus YSH_462411 TaxID=3071321 RepID=A0A976YDU6_9CAUD|nr:hypothetical protein QKV92_gp31 [Yangshan Harbor Nitrososphaeria virus]UVF62303.1 hypothetical protein [Nitrososphaeria virus YSH_462411]